MTSREFPSEDRILRLPWRRVWTTVFVIVNLIGVSVLVYSQLLPPEPWDGLYFCTSPDVAFADRFLEEWIDENDVEVTLEEILGYVSLRYSETSYVIEEPGFLFKSGVLSVQVRSEWSWKQRSVAEEVARLYGDILAKTAVFPNLSNTQKQQQLDVWRDHLHVLIDR